MPYLSINEVITCFRTPNTCTSRLLTDKKNLGFIPHLAVVATKTPNRITRTLLTTVIVLTHRLLFWNWSGTQLRVTVAENQSG